MIGREAAIPNPALAGLGWMIGTWTTEGSHPMVPGTTFHGRAAFEWHEGGAFLVMRSEIDEPEIPSGIAILGSDGASEALTLLYFDERAVARRYDASSGDRELRWWRIATDISQRYAMTGSSDGLHMHATGQLSQGGEPWHDDLSLTYARVR